MALTKTPIELSSTPSIVDGGNATAITIDSSEKVGIGTSSPSYLVHADAITSTDPSYFVASSGTDFVVAMGSQNSPGVAQEAFIGTISNHDFKIKTNNTEAFRITAARDMYFGQTTGSAASVGHIMQANGALFNTRSAGTVQFLRRLSSDGDIVEFKKDSGTMGQIGTYGGTIYIGSINGGIMFNGTDIEPTSGEATRADNTIDLGSANYRFNDAFLGGGIHLGGTGAANKLGDYEEGTWTAGFAGVSGNTATGTNTVHGYYTKIGRQVNLYFYINTINLGSITSGSYVILTGLPFAASAYSDLQWSYHRGGNAITGAYIQSGVSYAYLTDSSGIEIQQSANQTITALIGSASYMTNA